MTQEDEKRVKEIIDSQRPLNGCAVPLVLSAIVAVLTWFTCITFANWEDRIQRIEHAMSLKPCEPDFNLLHGRNGGCKP